MDVLFKCRVIEQVERYRLPTGALLHGALSAVAEQFKINRWDVKRWFDQSGEFEKISKTKQGKRKHKIGASKVKFLKQEAMLFDAVYIRRQFLGLWVDKYWLRAEFIAILELTKPDGYLDFKCSNGWVSGFCSRWKITKQHRTNKKDIPVSVKMPLLQEMHRQMYMLQAESREGKDPIYGRFSPLHMFSADQSPSEFAMPGKTTLNISGTPCWMWQPGSGLDKRFITIHLCIRAGGKQVIKPVVIFRGQGIAMSQEEIDFLNSLGNIRWYFQPKAWADTDFCVWWLEQFRADLQEAGVEEEVLLGLDGLKSQHNQQFFRAAAGKDTTLFYTPPDCTDVVAPCDHHVFARLKGLMKGFYRVHSEQNRDFWADSAENDSLCASKRRMLIASWVSEAWDVMCSGSDSEEFFQKAFTSTGFLMKLADPEALISIKGLPDYKFL